MDDGMNDRQYFEYLELIKKLTKNMGNKKEKKVIKNREQNRGKSKVSNGLDKIKGV